VVMSAPSIRFTAARDERMPPAAGGIFLALWPTRYSGSVTPEPPISLGMSCIFGKPSLMRTRVWA